jgi:hypothetical protein
MPRERVAELITAGVWHLVEGTAHDFGIHVGFDEPLPLGAMSAAETKA